MSNPTPDHLFKSEHIGPETKDDPNLFTLAEMAAAMGTDSLAVSAITSQVTSRAASGALDSVPVSTADSKGVSSGTRASVADSKAVSASAPTSVADSKALSVSVNTSMADSKAVSVATATPTLTVVAASQSVSTADSKAVSVAATAPTPAQSRTVASLTEHLANGAFTNVMDFRAGLSISDGSTNARPAFVLADAATGIISVAPGTYAIASNLTLTGSYFFAKGAKLKPASGVTITLSGQVMAAFYQIFDMSAGGTITFSSFNDVEANPIWFGALADYSGDSTTAFQKCFGSGAVRFYIPWGQYDVRGTITWTASRIKVRGEGLRSTIYFNPSANSTPLFQTTNDENTEFADLYCYNNNSGSRTGITCFDFAGGTDQVHTMILTGVVVERFNQYGLSVDSSMYCKVDRCRFYSNRKTVAGAPAVAINCTTYVNTFVVTRTRFGDNDKVALMEGATAVLWEGNSFESDGTSASSTATIDSIIEVKDAGGVYPRGFAFRDNYVEAPRPAAGANGFLKIVNAYGVDISGANIFSGELGGVAVTEKMIYLSACRGAKVQGAAFYQIITYFVEGDSSQSAVRVHDCAFFDNGSDLTTYNTVMTLMGGNRIELNNFVTSVFGDVGNIANGSSFTSGDVAMTSVAFDDMVLVSPDIALQGLSLTASVQSAAAVRYTLVNNTGSGVDLPAANFFFRVVKRDA